MFLFFYLTSRSCEIKYQTKAISLRLGKYKTEGVGKEDGIFENYNIDI